MAVVEYEHGGWNRVAIPEGGSVKHWAKDGLFNIYDAEGRCIFAPPDGVRVFFPNDDVHPDHVGEDWNGVRAEVT